MSSLRLVASTPPTPACCHLLRAGTNRGFTRAKRIKQLHSLAERLWQSLFRQHISHRVLYSSPYRSYNVPSQKCNRAGAAQIRHTITTWAVKCTYLGSPIATLTPPSILSRLRLCVVVLDYLGFRRKCVSLQFVPISTFPSLQIAVSRSRCFPSPTKEPSSANLYLHPHFRNHCGPRRQCHEAIQCGWPELPTRGHTTHLACAHQRHQRSCYSSDQRSPA